MLLADLVRASDEVAATSARNAKIARLAACLGGLTEEEVAAAVGFLAGEPRQGSVGVGWASLRSEVPPSSEPSLDVLDLDRWLTSLSTTSGQGSQAARARLISGLLAAATAAEQRFVRGLLLGDLRQGALQGLMVEAVAKAAGVPSASVRRAVMLRGDLGEVAAAALAQGAAGLSGFRLEVLRPLQPMLAQTAADLDDALARICPAAVEWKLDGARIQVHRAGNDVGVFTRSLADATARVPEIVAVVRDLPLNSVVLDGEAIGLRGDQRPLPFQDTMSRFGTAPEDPGAVQLVPYFFDCLHLDGEDLLDRPGEERRAALDSFAPDWMRVPRRLAEDLGEARGMLDDALRRGHEGVMVKGLGAPYEAGRRGASWLKVKPVLTLDLVVLAAEWGHGRRQGWLSNLHLGARDPAGADFIMLGKTFKGLTDDMLAWQTDRLLELAEGETTGWVVRVRPELVVEVAFDGVQTSPRYPGGVALRFARVKGYRPDKAPSEADTIDTVLAIHRGHRPGREA